jgi:hypothetical protein
MRLRIVELNNDFNLEEYVEYRTYPSSGPLGVWKHLRSFSTQDEAEQYAEKLIKLEKQTPKVVKEYDSNESLLLGTTHQSLTGTSK